MSDAFQEMRDQELADFVAMLTKLAQFADVEELRSFVERGEHADTLQTILDPSAWIAHHDASALGRDMARAVLDFRLALEPLFVRAAALIPPEEVRT